MVLSKREGAVRIVRFVSLGVLLLFVIMCSCATEKTADSDIAAGHDQAELMHMLEARDYFRLRTRLAGMADPRSPQSRFILAAVQSAFNRPAESNATIQSLLDSKEALTDTLRLRLLRLKLYNHLRLHRYRGAHEAALDILAMPASSLDTSIAAEVTNEIVAFRALADVPPQETTIRGSTVLQLENGRVPVKIHGLERTYTLDTGANFSVLMESEAEALGLEVMNVDLEVGASTGARTPADIAVADSLTIGSMDFRHVVFLIFPDAALTFPGGFRVPGLIGFPVIEAMGEIRFWEDGVLEIPVEPFDREVCNLALDQLNLLVLMEYWSDSLVCMLDSGANKTLFYEPFFRCYRSHIEASGQQDSVTAGGAGGLRRIGAYWMPEMEIVLGDTTVILRDMHVLTEAIRSRQGNYLFCNIGQDVLYHHGSYVINFHSMSFLLE